MTAENNQDTVVEEFPHKVFVGNLAFKTTQDELKEFFGEAGTVVQVNIITRGTRSLGYGFVAFSNHAECEAAVAKCHKKSLGGREINVEVAKPKSELAAAKKERAAKRAPRRRKGRRFAKKPTKTDSSPKQHDTEDGVVVSHGDEKKSDKSAKKKRKPKKRTPKDPDAPKPERVRRAPTGEPSKTTVFVANLPFSLDDEGLQAVFKDYKIKTAKVVRRRGTGRSKGFGFVELESEEEQTRLLEATGLLSEGRELNIKIALSDDRAEVKKEESA